MTLESDAIAGATIELLESRLHRLAYLLTGDTSWTGVPVAPAKPSSLEDSISRRLARLQNDLDALSRTVPAWEHTTHWNSADDRFPDLFEPPPSSSLDANVNDASAGFAGAADLLPTTQTMASIVLSYASAFPETASRLSSLKDLPVPDTEASASLIELQPRLDRLARVQDEQAREVSELRVRSARAIQRWCEISSLGAGECWADWEARLEAVEREVSREEHLRQRRQSEI